MDEKRYYRNRTANTREQKPARPYEKPAIPEEKQNKFTAYMFMQSVVCLTILGLILLSKVAFTDVYSEVKEAFSNSWGAKTQVEDVFSQGAEYIESLPVFSQLFEEEEKSQSKDVLITKTEEDEFTRVNGYIENEFSEDAVCPVFGGTVTSGYGLREDPFSGETANHQGIDVGINIGTGVAACFDGTVICVASDEYLGNYIVLEHENGLQTKYGHLLCPLVSEGQTVVMGDRIGLSGNSGQSTGPHLHFAVIKDGKYVNPLDYVEF